ncbi:MAG: hypothetical protein A2Z20_05465 [Bdellovibrionales bacterium RBG_16_40_8]|nr:MAG: hypothetical protein A2Z20_05465 [Bdellovibrionales bacterium RBG_16_40_8]
MKKSARTFKSKLNNERGMALIESLPLLIIFVMLLSFQLGFFGIVHTGIMNSMASRAYAFETFRNRSDVTIFRDDDKREYYAPHGTRFHSVKDERRHEDEPYATSRPLKFGSDTTVVDTSKLAEQDDHNEQIYNPANYVGGNPNIRIDKARYEKIVSPAWVMVGYGMCINARCGD